MAWLIKLYKRFFIKEIKEFATGRADGVLFLKVLGLQDKQVQSLEINIDATDVVRVKTVCFVTKDEVGGLVTILQEYKKING